MSDDEREEYNINEIMHCSTYPGGYACDYIVPGGTINYPLKKGIASGIYGISQIFLESNGGSFPDDQKGCEFLAVKMELPYIINSIEECKRFLSANKYLDISFQKFVDLLTYENIIMEDKDFLKIAEEFISIIKEDFLLTNVKNALNDFWYDYNNRKKYVESPINYILKKEGNDGVMSHPSVEECHNWLMGDVKFIPYLSKENRSSIPIRYIRANNTVIDLDTL